MKENKVDIIFLDGLEPPNVSPKSTFLTYLFTLASVLENHNYSFKILNITTLGDYSLDGIINCLRKYTFKAIGITTNVDNINYVYKVVEAINNYFPEVVIILGGAQVTFSDLKTLKECKCDIIVRSEGEETLIKLLDYYIMDIGNIIDINGITYRNNGEIVQNQNAPLLDINEFPTPQYAIIKNEKYWIVPEDTPYKNFHQYLKGVAAANSIFFTGRGCPYRCSFCVEGNLNVKQRKRDTEKVIQDFKYFLEIFDTPYIVIGDDTFTSGPKRVVEICRELKKLKENKDFIWFAEGRVDILSKNLFIIPIMRDAGLYKLQIGIESGSQKILDIYEKGITLQQIETVVSECSKIDDIIVHGNFILGNPGETKETFNESLLFAKKLIALSNYKIDLSSGYLTPFVGTPIREDPGKYELEILYEDFEFNKTAFVTPICKPKNIDLEDLEIFGIQFESEITKYYRDNIWNLPKHEIDKKIRFDKKFGSSETGVITKAWAKTFYKLLTLQRYYKLLDQNSSIETSSKPLDPNEIKMLCPLRLWDIDFITKENVYKFISFNNEQVIISDKDVFLWEMASGKNTIEDIINHSFCPFPNNDQSLNYIFKFYQQLEEKFALIFRAF